MEHLASTDTVPLRSFFWAHGDDFGAFEAGLEEDPTVEDPRRIAATKGSQFYRVTHPDDLPAVQAYKASIELDAVVTSLSGSIDGFEVHMRFPDRDALSAWRDRLRDLGLELDVQAIYDEDELSPERRYGLTDQQHEALLAAARKGYFSIPRETSLAGLADELGVSSQAASERLRRGMEKLVCTTLGEETDD